MEQMMEQTMEHLLAKIAAMQEKVVSHYEKINASQEPTIAKMAAWLIW
jgi:hypothetical protein